MRKSVRYICSVCGSTKTIVADSERVGRPITEIDFPKHILCGVRGCEGISRPMPNHNIVSTEEHNQNDGTRLG